MLLPGTEVSGLEFNLYHVPKETKFYKFLNDNLTHYGFTYTKGLNIDTAKFRPNGSCTGGGLYFCKESNCDIYWKDYGSKVALIEIPDDAQVYIELYNFKADRLIIKDIVDFVDMDDDFWLDILPLENSAHVLEYVREQTNDICEFAVKQCGHNLEYVKKQTQLICELAVNQNGLALQYVKEQTSLICELAIKQDGLALQFVKEEYQTFDICIIAVKQNGRALEYVKTQTPEICIAAINQHFFALQYVHKQTPELCVLAIQLNSKAIEYVKKEFSSSLLTNDMCFLAVKRDIKMIQYVPEEYQTEIMCKFVVQQNYRLLKYIKNPSKELCILAVQLNSNALEFVPNEYKTLCAIASITTEQDSNNVAYENESYSSEECVIKNDIMLDYVRNLLEQMT